MEYFKVLVFLVILINVILAIRKGIAKQKANAPGKAPKPHPVHVPSPEPKYKKRAEARSLERLGRRAVSLEKKPIVRDLEAEGMANLHEHPYSHRLLGDTLSTQKLLEQEAEHQAPPVVTDWKQAVIASVILEKKEY